MNNAPGAPTGLTAQTNGGKWTLRWTAPSDDHTAAALLRYQVAVATQIGGPYRYASTNIAYSPHQGRNTEHGSMGNVPISNFFKTGLSSSTKTAYWKVRAIDTAYKPGPWSSVKTNTPVGPAGSFIGPTAFSSGIQMGTISVGDMDNDGDLDMIVTGATNGIPGTPGKLLRYLNDGSGAFGAATLILSSPATRTTRRPRSDEWIATSIMETGHLPARRLSV